MSCYRSVYYSIPGQPVIPFPSTVHTLVIRRPKVIEPLHEGRYLPNRILIKRVHQIPP